MDVFARIWCCWELYCAAQGGFLQSDKYIVTGPSRFPNPENWDIGKADASNLEDKRLIMLAVDSAHNLSMQCQRSMDLQLKGLGHALSKLAMEETIHTGQATVMASVSC